MVFVFVGLIIMSRHIKLKLLFLISAPWRRPLSIRIWNPLQIPITGTPLFAFSITLFDRPNHHLSSVPAIACDTDGIDGTEDNAGALYLPTTPQMALKQNINLVKALQENDGYGAFKKLGNLVITGPTLTNVNDFRAILIQ